MAHVQETILAESYKGVSELSFRGGPFVFAAIFACEAPNTQCQGENADNDRKVRAFFAPTSSRNLVHQIESGTERQRGFCTDSMWVVEVAQLRLCSCEKVAAENDLLEMTAL